MEYNNDGSEMWDWPNEDYGLQPDVSNSLWNQNDDDLSCVFNGTTPLKACGDLAYQVTDNENVNKGMESCKEASSQSKRRRMLQFDDEALNILPLCDEEMPSSLLRSKEREDPLDDALSDMTQWVSGFADNMSASGSGYEGLEQSSEGWLADCLINDTEMHLSPDDINPSETSDVQTDLADVNNSQPGTGAITVQKRPTPIRRNIIFKGKKSLIKTPTKIASSVVLPFDFVKPSGMQGAVTLKDINQKILTPPLSKSKQTDEDPEVLYPKSAFSGKPVVGKTKIRTEGGKGSITIMRTKG